MTDRSTQMVGGDDESFPPGTYGASFADVYDEWYPDVSDANATARFVSGFGPQQTILELGLGTGRLAREISGAGHAVFGVEVSPEMLARIPRSLAAWVVGADMSCLSFPAGVFDTVIVATNTLFNLPSADRQQACFDEGRRVLRPGGRMVIEAFVPPTPDPALDRLVTTKTIELDKVELIATIRDADSQTITGQHIEIAESGIRLRPWRVRYASPVELDEMARTAGFELANRFADWDSTPFSETSDRHVSVYLAIPG